MLTETITRKQKPRQMPTSVTQGSRILGQTGGRPAQLFLSKKSAGICPVESPVEKVIGKLADLDPRVRSIHAQPFTIDVVSGRILHTRQDVLLHRQTRQKTDVILREYTPDFHLGLIDGQRVVIEVKNPRYPCEQAYWDKVARAKGVLQTNGYRFQVISMPYEPSTPLIHNADLLASLRLNFKKTVSKALIDTIETEVGGSDSTLGHVAQLAGMTLREAPVLVLLGVVAADISQGYLGAGTPIRLAYGDLQHLAILDYEGSKK